MKDRNLWFAIVLHLFHQWTMPTLDANNTGFAFLGCSNLTTAPNNIYTVLSWSCRLWVGDNEFDHLFNQDPLCFGKE